MDAILRQVGVFRVDFVVYNFVNDLIFIVLTFLVGAFSAKIARVLEYMTVMCGRDLFNYHGILERRALEPKWWSEVARTTRQKAFWGISMGVVMIVCVIAHPLGDLGLEPYDGVQYCDHPNATTVTLRRMSDERMFNALYRGNDMMAKAEFGRYKKRLLDNNIAFAELSARVTAYYTSLFGVARRMNGDECDEDSPYWLPNDVTMRREVVIMESSYQTERASVRTNLENLQNVDGDLFEQFPRMAYHSFKKPVVENHTFDMHVNLLPPWEAGIIQRPPWEPVMFEMEEAKAETTVDDRTNETITFRHFGYVSLPVLRSEAFGTRPQGKCTDPINKGKHFIVRRQQKLAKLAVGLSETGVYVKKSLAKCTVYTCADSLMEATESGKRSNCMDGRPKGDSFIMKLADRSEDQKDLQQLLLILMQGFKINANIGFDFVNSLDKCSLMNVIHGAVLMFEESSEQRTLCEKTFVGITVLYLVPLILLGIMVVAMGSTTTVMLVHYMQWRRHNECEVQLDDVSSVSINKPYYGVDENPARHA
mmetsp:Transcript_1420/g.4232  ORF Transcript_1420/g.4232 Transcript_1420/m.4232 type:complete len:536 (-) Transcript_1420:366-1973(-)